MMRRFFMTGCALSVLLQAGCAVGPDFRKPAAPAGEQYGQAGRSSHVAGVTGEAEQAASGRQGVGQVFHVGQDIPAQWWRLFHSEALNALVQKALDNNPSLESARDALSAAQQNKLAQQSAFYPSISGSFNPTRNKTSRTYSPVPNNNSWLYTVHTAQLNISYVPDFWGGVRRGAEAAKALRNAQRDQLRAVYLTLTSSVVQAAIDYAAIKAQIETTRSLVTLQRDLLESARMQEKAGEFSRNDVALQHTALAQNEATLAPLQKQLEQQKHLIAALVGDSPDVPQPEFTFDELTLPADLPVSVPARLIEQRPDIRTAQDNWHAACAQVGVAVANRLPNIELGATPGFAAASIAKMAAPGYGQWQIAAMVTQPLFDAGLLRHQENAARAAYDQAASEYRSTLITALQDVADTFTALRLDATTLADNAEAATAAGESLKISLAQYKYGAISQIVMLNAQQAHLETELALAQSRADRLSDTVALFQALGGGWWNNHGSDAPHHPSWHPDKGLSVLLP
ncbi:efflux transporter outer membrane subunit [Acetobacter thailandicus]|uniref:Efflux transporter outer membrane subunit n=1 Tax=Acetobacter thailandicus TaxID=1502842 RepID=A0ABT3QEF9_9PROT|nr:efflux transporter outer membrane subunit [Acetobacter thailandicus]MCX2563665.1 efflux transporter outer membrane subunit [Acetobacter thailandicus]